MVQKKILNETQNEVEYNAVKDMMRYKLKNSVMRLSTMGVERNVMQFNRQVNQINGYAEGTTMNGETIRITQSTVLEENRTSETKRHALKLLVKRTLNGGKVRVDGKPWNLITKDDTKRIFDALIGLKEQGFDYIYTAYNSKYDYVVGTAKRGKVPNYAYSDGDVMNIDYALKLIFELYHLSRLVAPQMNELRQLKDLNIKRKNFGEEVVRSDERYVRLVKECSEIIDVAMQGMKKKDKMRALSNLVISKNKDDSRSYYETKAIEWINANPFTEEDVETTKNRIYELNTLITNKFREIDCEVTIAERIFWSMQNA